MIRRQYITCLAIGVVILQAAGFAPHPRRARSHTPMDGIWRYMNPGMNGQGFFFDGHYVLFSTSAGASVRVEPLPDSIRAALYDEILLNAGTFTVSDTIATAVTQYSKRPREIGTTWRWSFFMKGDTCTYHVLKADGQVDHAGRLVRIRTD